MKALLMTFAVIELGVGALMLAAPSLILIGLLGSPLGTTAESIITRLAGVALIALALACWLLRNEGRSRAMEGLVWAVLLWNGGAAGVLLYAGPGLGLFGPGFWPGVLLHTAMAVWCLLALLHKPARVSAGE
jgi:hypothetical protein